MNVPRSYYHQAERALLIYIFGSRCLFCDSSIELQFAHKRPNSLHGHGRGSFCRIKDIELNPDNYMLLCATCHYNYDKQHNNRWINAKGIEEDPLTIYAEE